MTTTAPPASAPPRWRTAADLVRELGDIPLDRILVTPPPGTATEADLLRKVEVDKQLCELVAGTLVEKPVGLYESQVAAMLLVILHEFVAPRQLGALSGEAGTLRLAPGTVRLPDVAFISFERFGGKPPSEPIPSIAPDLAVEVLSESNTKKEIEKKVKEYLNSGTRLIWIIDPVTRSAVVHRPSAVPQQVAPDGVLDGADVLPGFALALVDLFRRVDAQFKGPGK